MPETQLSSLDNLTRHFKICIVKSAESYWPLELCKDESLTWNIRMRSLIIGPYSSAQATAKRWGAFTLRAQISPRSEYSGPGRSLRASDLSHNVSRILQGSAVFSVYFTSK